MSPAALMWPVEAQAGQCGTVGVWVGTGAGWPLGQAPQRGLGPTLCLPCSRRDILTSQQPGSSPVLLPPQNPTLQVSTRRAFSLCPVWPWAPGSPPQGCGPGFPRLRAMQAMLRKQCQMQDGLQAAPCFREQASPAGCSTEGSHPWGVGEGPPFLPVTYLLTSSPRWLFRVSVHGQGPWV